ncbi:hypothetical protein D3C87_1330770 [compost metagenome]
MGRAGKRPDVSQRTDDDRRPAFWPDLRRHSAGAGLSGRPERGVSRPGPGAAARLSGVLLLAAQHLRRPWRDPRRQAWQPRMAAGQGRRALGKLLAGCTARAAAEHLSVHRQRPGRGRPGQAAHPGGDHRSPDATADPRRNLRPAAQPRTVGRRILRSAAARSAPRPRVAARYPATGA